MLNDQDLSTYGIIQNLAWGGSVPALAEQLGWDAQAVVSRVREGEGPQEPVRVYRLSGQLVLDGALECDQALLEALGAAFEGVAQAALAMLGEVLRRTFEAKIAPVPEDTTPLSGDWVQTAVRVLVGEDSYEIRQYMRPTDVAEVVRIFSAEDEAEASAGDDGAPFGDDGPLLGDDGPLLGDEGPLLGDEGPLLGDEGPLLGDEGPLLSEADLPEAAREDPAPAPKPKPKAKAPAAPSAPPPPPVPFEVQQWPPVSDSRPGPAAPAPLDLLYDVPLTVRAELGRTRRKVEDIIRFGPGTVVDLDRMVGDMVDIFANGQWVARGEVVVVEDNFGVRITEIGSAQERALKLRLREGS